MYSRITEIVRTPFSYWQGLVYYKMGKWDAADACFKAALKICPDHVDSLFKRGMISYKDKQWAASFPFIQKAVFLNQDDTQRMKQFRILEDRLDGETAKSLLGEKELLAAVEKTPKSAFLQSQLARCFRAGNKWWLQIDALKEAVKLEGSNSSYHSRYGEALEQMKRYRQAAAEYEQAILLAERAPLWYYKVGHALSKIPGAGPTEMEKARIFYEAAVNHPKNHKQKHLGVGLFHQKSRRWELAADAYQESMRVLGNSDIGQVSYNLALCCDRCYRWEQAEHWYEVATRHSDCKAEWHYRLGFVRERQGKFLAAAEAYRRAAETSSKPISAWFYRLGQVLAKAGQPEQACEAYIRSKDSDDGGATIDMAWLDEDEAPVGTIDERLENVRLRLIQQLAQDATDADAWWKLGGCLERRSLWQEAENAYRQSVMRTPAHVPERYYRLGHCLVELGRHDEACEVFASLRAIRHAHGLNKSLFEGDAAFRKIAIYTEYYETLQVEPKTVFYESFHGRNMSCNPYALFLRLLEDEQRRDWTHVWSVCDLEVVPGRFKAMKNVIFIIRGSDAYMRCLASAGLLINNVTFDPYFIRKEGQTYLNTWHGTPWKMIGKDVRGEPFIYGNMSRNFLQATHLLSSNAHTSEKLIHSYDIGGLRHGTLIESGYPRIDITLNATEADKVALRKRLHIDGSKKVVLYAPTWRGSHGSPELEAEEVAREVARLRQADCHLLFRGHTLSDSRQLDSHVPDDITTNELLSVVDVLVTDYSSIWFDFLATGRPILFFLKDLEQYLAERGLYFGIDRLPGPVSRNLDELATDLRGQLLEEIPLHPRYESAKREFCAHEDGNAGTRVIQSVFEPKPEEVKSSARSVLLFGGKMIPNGITSSLTNLLEAVDHSQVDITLIADTGWFTGDGEDDAARMRRLASAVHILPRVGRINLTHEEKWIQEMFRDEGALPSTPEIGAIYQKSFAREYRRLLGGSGFDAAVDFEGYNVFWNSILGSAPRELVAYKTVYQHNDLMSECRVRFPYLVQIFDLYRNFDRVVSVSRMTMELNQSSLSDRFNISESKFGYVENLLTPSTIGKLAAEDLEGTDEEDYFGGPGPVFITLGRLSIEKDHRKLISAFVKVVKQQPTAQLVLVGDGPLRAKLEKQIRKLELTGNVRLLGFRSNPFCYLRKADCFVLSSNHEGQPMVLLEAMILGKPIIATDITGTRGVIEGRSGELVENSVAGLVRGMLDFIEGKVVATPVDMEAYRSSALNAFYSVACNLPISVDMEKTGTNG